MKQKKNKNAKKTLPFEVPEPRDRPKINIF